MLAFSLDLAVAVYHATGYDAVFPHFVGADYPLAFLYGPLLYVYARALSNRERIFDRRYLWHFLPFALLVLFLVPFYLQSGGEKMAFVRAPGSGLWAQALGTINHFKLVHALVYVGMILSLLKRHRYRIQDRFSSIERINLNWLRDLMIGIVVLMMVSIALYILSLGGQRIIVGLDPSTINDDYMLLGLACLVYGVGFMGLRQPEIFDGRRHSDSQPSGGRHSRSVGRSSSRAAPDERPYARSGMSQATAERYQRRLIKVMQSEKLYRRGDLTLQDLSDALAISPHNLTEVINTQLGQNFYDFVNSYRVREVKDRLADPEFAHLTVLAVALESGFNSKSAFNAVFKKHTKMTPSQFRSIVRQAPPSQR
jgi:AraC-like DNA-binding protein